MVYITPSNANDVVELKLDSVLADKTSSDSVEIKNKSIVTKNDTILASSFSQFIKKNAILVIEFAFVIGEHVFLPFLPVAWNTVVVGYNNVFDILLQLFEQHQTGNTIIHSLLYAFQRSAYA